MRAQPSHAPGSARLLVLHRPILQLEASELRLPTKQRLGLIFLLLWSSSCCDLPLAEFFLLLFSSSRSGNERRMYGNPGSGWYPTARHSKGDRKGEKSHSVVKRLQKYLCKSMRLLFPFTGNGFQLKKFPESSQGRSCLWKMGGVFSQKEKSSSFCYAKSPVSK